MSCTVHVHVMNHESLANCEFASLLLPVFYVYIMQLHIIHVNFIHIHYVYSRMFMMYNLHVRTDVHGMYVAAPLAAEGSC